MTNQHPITPPDELVQQWTKDASYKKGMAYPEGYEQCEQRLCTAAAQWGADQELDACCEWLVGNYNYPQGNHPLRAARRPKPPSLKEQALADLYAIYTSQPFPAGDSRFNCIRRALEALPE
jgi:hypothetical protein